MRRKRRDRNGACQCVGECRTEGAQDCPDRVANMTPFRSRLQLLLVHVGNPPARLVDRVCRTSTTGKLLTGKHAPSATTLAAYASAFGVSLDWLSKGGPNPTGDDVRAAWSVAKGKT